MNQTKDLRSRTKNFKKGELMESENDQEAKAFIVLEIWEKGIEKAGGLKLTGATDDKLYQVWTETIDFAMEQLYEFPDDFKEWKQQSPDDKYKYLSEGLLNYESFIGQAESLIDLMKTKLSNTKQAEEENRRKIISRAFSRASNMEIESGIDLEPGKELMSSEKITELGITKKNLLDSLNMDPQVEAADCVNGEFIVKTIYGEISFRLVFGDEASGGRA
jgi:hypothetical protein